MSVATLVMQCERDEFYGGEGCWADVVQQDLCCLCRTERLSNIVDGLCGAWSHVDAVKLVVFDAV